MVEEVTHAIGYIAVYPNGDIHQNSKGIVPLYNSWGSAISALKRGSGRWEYEADRLRIIPVYS